MESNKDKAIKAIDMAERKISENDYVGAKKLVNKAQNLYPKLDGLKQVSMMVDVYISASNKINREGEADWYGVLCVDPLANDEALKKQHKKLALLLHPDKNKFTGATEVFKMVSEAWCLLSDKANRIAYDQKRKLYKHKKSGAQQKPPKRHEPDFSWKKPKPEPEPEPEPKHEREREREHEHEPDFSWKYKDFSKTLPCPNCRQDFVATEIVREMINGRPVIRFSKFRTDTCSYSNTSASDSAKAAEERMRAWFKPDP